jgi:hypothetical protein
MCPHSFSKADHGSSRVLLQINNNSSFISEGRKSAGVLSMKNGDFQGNHIAGGIFIGDKTGLLIIIDMSGAAVEQDCQSASEGRATQ